MDRAFTRPRPLLSAALLAPLLLCAGCGSSGSYPACGQTLSGDDFSNLMSSHLLAFSQIHQGVEQTMSLAGDLISTLEIDAFVMTMADPTIVDFGGTPLVPQLSVSFGNGVYTVTQQFLGKTVSYSFQLFAGSAFGSFNAGDLITSSIFDLSSYVTGVSISGFPHPGIHFNQGPLYSLASGSVSPSGVSTSGLSLSLQLNTSLLQISLGTAQSYPVGTSNSSDSFTINLNTARASINTLASQLASGAFAASLDGSSWNSTAMGLRETFSGSSISVQGASGGPYAINVTDNAQATTSKLTYYPSNSFSSGTAPTATFYCDSAQTQVMGVSRPNTSWLNGTFFFPNGSTFFYGLSLL